MPSEGQVRSMSAISVRDHYLEHIVVKQMANTLTMQFLFTGARPPDHLSYNERDLTIDPSMQGLLFGWASVFNKYSDYDCWVSVKVL